MRHVLLLVLVPALLPAQNTSSTISGTLQDPGGAVIAGAQVTLTGEGNGFVRTVTTNNEGFFSFPDLAPASYTLAIESPGFKRYRQTGIEITSSEQRSLGRLVLQIGEVSEAVTVSAEVVTVNLANGEKSGTITSDQLETLALRGRDIFDAISLLPGVVDTSDGRDAPGPTSIGNIYILGGRNDAKNMTVDGITNLDTGSNGTVHSMPSMDSVAEVKVLMAVAPAEYGRNSGGSINVITKGGSKQLHATAYWNYRHESLNANDFFSNLAGRPRSPYRYNIGGYTIGGPVLLPKLKLGRQKLFFFFSQEFQHQTVQYGTKTVTVPTALERAGDFSQSLDSNGKPVPAVSDPLNGKKAFPGGVIPASRLTSTGKNILNLFPLPNYVDPNPSRVFSFNYFSAASGAYPRRTEAARIDYSPRDNWQVYGRVQNNSDEQHTPYTTWVTGSVNFPLTPIVFQQPGRGAMVRSINTISQMATNELTVGVSQNTLRFYPEDLDAVDRTKRGINIPQRNPKLNPLNLIPNMSFGGIANPANPSMNDGLPYFNRNNIFSITDNLTKIRNTHTIKGGVYFERTQKFQSASSVTHGTIKFDRDTNNALDANNAYANALLGVYDTYAEATARPQGSYLFTNLEVYLQDTWRAKKNLSIEYGLRVYHDPPQYDTRHQLASFSLGLYDPANAPVLLRPGFDANNVKVAIDPRSGAIFPAGLIGAYAPGYGNPANGSFIGGQDGYPEGLFSVPALAYAPRLSFAWDPFGQGRTSIRGGGGIFFDRIEGNPTMGQITNPPVIYTPTQYYGTFDDIAVTASSGLLAPTGSITSLAGKGHQQVAYNFSLAINQQIGHSMVGEVSYAGSLGRHMLWQRNINPVPLGATFVRLHPENKDPTASGALPPNFLRPYQGLGDVMLYEFATASNYHSLQGRLQQRYRHGVNFGVSYTFSKALDTVDSYSNAVDPFFNPRSRNYGPAGYDRTHVFTANYYWTLPKVSGDIGFRPLHWIADNWGLSGVTRFMTGAPFTPSYSLVNSVDVVGSPSAAAARPMVTHPNAPALERFGPISLVSPPGPLFGNAGKNILRQPGTENFDISLSKTLRVTERLSGILRFETYNTFNHTQFSTVDMGVKFDATGASANPLFMQPTAARPPRRIQLSMSMKW